MMRFLVVCAVLVLVPCGAYAEVRSIAFPVLGTFSFRNDYGDPRGDGTRKHVGNDIIAEKMTPLVAATDGFISFIAIPQVSWGYSLTLRDADGYAYRYIHLNNDTPGTDDGAGGETRAYAAGIDRGVSVKRGQLLGWVGDSGNAENTVPHLHFEIETPSGANINPYDSLFAAAGGNGRGTYVAPIVEGDTGSSAKEEVFVVTRQLQEGMVDRDVVGLHNELALLGFYTGSSTEAYTSVTREAVRRFQVSRGIAANGIANAETRKAVSRALREPRLIPGTPPMSSLQLGSTGPLVTALQVKLNELKYLTVQPTGYFGPLTRAAVIAFQKAKGIDPIGIVGPKTRAALLSI